MRAASDVAPTPPDPLKDRMNRRLSQLHWSLVELSERTGESYRNVHRWMREDVRIPAHFLSRFVEVVPVNAAWLLSGSGSPDPVEPTAAEAALQQIAQVLASVRVTASTGTMAEQVLEGSMDGIVAFDREFRYTLWNPAMVRITGIPADDVVGQVAFDRFPALRESEESTLFPGVLEGATVSTEPPPFRTPGTARSGWFEARYSPLRDASGVIIGGLGLVRDVTAWKELVERLRESEERYRMLLELQSDPILVQAEGEIVYANQALAELLAMDAAELPGRRVSEVVRGEQTPDDWAGSEATPEGRRLRRRDGTEVPVDVRSVGIAVDGRPGVQELYRPSRSR